MNKIISWALYFTAMFAPLLIWGWEADSQNPQVTVVGAITPGDCTRFLSTLQLADTGAACGTVGSMSLGGPATGTNGTLNLLGSTSGQLQATVTSTGQGLFATQAGQAIRFFTGSANDAFEINGSTTSVNFLQVSPSNTGTAVALLGTGTDTNVNLALTGKGSGAVLVSALTGSGQLVIENNSFSANAELTTGTTGGHLAILQNGGGTPSLTAGCNGAGSGVVGNDTNGTVTGQTAAATTCTLTFGTAYGTAPNCSLDGLSSPLTGAITVGTGTIVVNFASTANFKWSYVCFGT